LKPALAAVSIIYWRGRSAARVMLDRNTRACMLQ
jgi:hypothetical protein